ncbi:MAG: hypothetical protein QOF09_4149 [Alphaproteobacteria bacterium]|jgi:hypothetical protein|nr:hypothetical protein [Alphaproteobacteria bacterium]
MRWFRSSRRSWGFLALLALALQLGLSFGHVHAGHGGHPVQHDAATPDRGDDRGHDHEDDHESHYCAIYAFNALLTAAQVAAAPPIPMPATWTVADVSIAAAVACAGFRHTAFRSRAPPLS